MRRAWTVNEKLLDKIIRHAVYIERFKSAETRKIVRQLHDKVFPLLREKLTADLNRIGRERLGQVWKVEHLRGIIDSVDRIIAAGMVQTEQAIINDLMDLAEWEAKWNANLIERTIPVDISMNLPSVETVRQAVLTKSMEGHKLSTWFKSFEKSIRIKMMEEIKQGIIAGEGLPEIGRRLRNVTVLKRRQAEYIARTAVSSVVHHAREETFKQNEDIVKEVMWVSTLDERTTDICQGLDGRVFPINEGPRPPIHFNCRSTIVPVVSSWKELGIEAPPEATRASMKGEVPAKLTYEEWAARNPDVEYTGLSLKELKEKDIIE